MIYDVKNLINGLGGLEKTKEALECFRTEVKKAGFPGLHLQIATRWEGAVNLSGVDANMQGSMKDLLPLLNVDSLSHYQFCHFVHIDRD